MRGRGYDAAALAAHLRRRLGLDRRWPTAIFGAGSLGSALAAYPGFRRGGIEIRAVFDNDPAKIGKRRGGLRVLPMKDLARVVRRARIELGLVCVPADAAQEVAEAAARAGVRGLLNFAPVRLELPETVRVKQVDLGVVLEDLTFHLS